MAFTWKPLESRGAHTLSTSLWPGMEIAAILSATTRAEQRGLLQGNKTGTPGDNRVVAVGWRLRSYNRAKMNSTPGLPYFHTQPAAVFVHFVSKFSSPSVGRRQTSIFPSCVQELSPPTTPPHPPSYHGTILPEMN